MDTSQRELITASGIEYKYPKLLLAEICTLRSAFAVRQLPWSALAGKARKAGTATKKILQKLYLSGVTLEAHVVRIFYRQPITAYYTHCSRQNCAFEWKLNKLDEILRSLPEEQERVFAQSCAVASGRHMGSKLVSIITGISEERVIGYINSCREMLETYGIDEALFVRHFLSSCTARSPAQFKLRTGVFPADFVVPNRKVPFELPATIIANANVRLEQPSALIIPDDGDLRTFSGSKFSDIEDHFKLNATQLKMLQARFDGESSTPLTIAQIAEKLAVSTSHVDKQLEVINEQMRIMGLSLWHYVTACLVGCPEFGLWNVADNKLPSGLICKPPFMDRMAGILRSLSAAELFVIQCRSQLDCQGRPQATKKIAAIIIQNGGRMKSKRTVEKQLQAFNALLKKEKINVWTILVAVTEGNPQLIKKSGKRQFTGLRASGGISFTVLPSLGR